MKNLEKLASSLFHDFSYRQVGPGATWAYLSPERQMEWIKEVYTITTFVLDELRKDVKPIPPITTINTSYAMGFNDGLKKERIDFITKLHDLKVALEKEMEVCLIERTKSNVQEQGS